jgi:hypothetical protein
MRNETIQSVIQHIHSAGISITLTPEKGLRVSSASGLTPSLRELLRFNKPGLVDFLLQPMPPEADSQEPEIEPFLEPKGYEGTGWRLAGANGLSPQTLAKFYSASLALDRSMQTNEKKLKNHGT